MFKLVRQKFSHSERRRCRFEHAQKSSIVQEVCYLVTGLHLPHAKVVRSHAHTNDVVILIPEFVGLIGV